MRKNIKEPTLYTVEIHEKSFIKDIKGCSVINVKDYSKEISYRIDDETGNELELIEIEGYIKLSVTEKTKKPKDDILTLILKEIKEIKSNVKELKHDMVEVKEDVAILKEDVVILKKDVSTLQEDVAIIKKCPTVAKELVQSENINK